QTVRCWDLATEKEVRRLEGHRGRATAVAFLPGGRRLVSGSWDHTALVWDVSGLAGPGKPAAGRVSGRELKGLWGDLGAGEAARAYRAVRALADAPGDAVPFLRERLRPVPGPDPKHIERLVADLGSGSFADRQKATAELERLGFFAAPALRAALAAGPSLEV